MGYYMASVLVFLLVLFMPERHALAQQQESPLTTEEVELIRQLGARELEASSLQTKSFKIIGLSPPDGAGPLQTFHAPLGEWSAFRGTSSVRPRNLATIALGQEIISPAPADPLRRAVGVHYSYARGGVIRLFIDLRQRSVIGREIEFNAPAPLAEEEMSKAVAIARRSDGSLDRELAEVGPHQIAVYAHPLIDNNKSSPRYAHRMADIFVSPRGSQSSTYRYSIDLSMEELILRNH